MKRCSGTFLAAFAEACNPNPKPQPHPHPHANPNPNPNQVCSYGFDPNGAVTTDQFGNAGVSLFNRMLGPRYPHRWASGTCDDYRGFWQDYEAGNKRRVRIKGDVGPLSLIHI